jgi:hypothetical protein
MKKWMLLLSAIFLMMPLSPKAQSELSNREEVFTFLKDAYRAQVSLSEQTRSMQEINDILSPYFSNEYQTLFVKENVVEEEGQYITYGSDFALYFIPFFQFTDDTKVVIEPKEIYIFEYIPENTDGPVGYKSHYEGLLMKKVSGKWKVAEYLNNIPQRLIDQAHLGKEERKPKVNLVTSNNHQPVALPIADNPLNTYSELGVSSSLENSTIHAMFRQTDLIERLAFQ